MPKKDTTDIRKIRRILADQGIAFNGDKFTKATVVDLLKYCKSEQFSKPTRPRRQGSF